MENVPENKVQANYSTVRLGDLDMNSVKITLVVLERDGSAVKSTTVLPDDSRFDSKCPDCSSPLQFQGI